jgi:hypothetical protein
LEGSLSQRKTTVIRWDFSVDQYIEAFAAEKANCFSEQRDVLEDTTREAHQPDLLLPANHCEHPLRHGFVECSRDLSPSRSGA